MNSRSLGFNIVGVQSRTSNNGASTGSSINNNFHCDAIDAILENSERDETETGFSLYCTPAEDLF